MARHDNIRLTRRDMLKLGAGGAGMFMIGAGGLAIPKGLASGGGGGGGSVYIEAFPTSPLTGTLRRSHDADRPVAQPVSRVTPGWHFPHANNSGSHDGGQLGGGHNPSRPVQTVPGPTPAPPACLTMAVRPLWWVSGAAHRGGDALRWRS